jgi:hypothetical protein
VIPHHRRHGLCLPALPLAAFAAVALSCGGGDRYLPAAVAPVRHLQVQEVTRFWFRAMAETMFHCPGAEIASEDSSVIRLRFLRVPYDQKATAPLPLRYDATGATYIDVPNPSGKAIVIE